MKPFNNLKGFMTIGNLTSAEQIPMILLLEVNISFMFLKMACTLTLLTYPRDNKHETDCVLHVRPLAIQVVIILY